MAKLSADNLKAMKIVSQKKFVYGIKQVKVGFSANHNIANDKKAIEGKRVLREKIYSQV